MKSERPRTLSAQGLINEDFVPRRWLRNSHLQTLAGNFLPRVWTLPEPESRIIEVEAATEDRPATSLLCHCHWQPEEVRRDRLTLILIHGLEGSSKSQYVLGNASRAWAAGCNVVRMNMRSCGGTDTLSPTIYHSGRSGDVSMVMDDLIRAYKLRAIALIGYSMGGNMVLKLAGEWGEDARPELKAVVGISPLMDLAVSSAALHEPRNRVYEWKFLRSMLRRFRQKIALFPHIYTTQGLDRIRSLRGFDQEVVARYGGFADADDYYYTVASSNVAHRLAVPTLVVHSLDDPFIRMLDRTRRTLSGNEHVTFIETRHGGHCAFLAPAKGYDGYWAERTLLSFLMDTVRSGG
jgi:predicted alpha/beta-fold hydrolase